MKRIHLAGVAAVAILSASPASAATVINLVTVPGVDASVGLFGDLNPSGSRTDLYQFTLPRAGELAAFIKSIGVRAFGTNLDFTSVKLNGVEFVTDSTGALELRTISRFLPAGSHTLSVGYRNAQAFSAYGGVVAFTTGAVPEPATWGMMIMGFGLAGAALRTRRRSTRVAFA